MQNYEPDVTQLLGLYQQLEDDIVADMVRRMLRMGFVSETTAYQAEVLQTAGILYDDILQMIAGRTDASVAQVRVMFEDAGVQTVEIDNDTHEAAGEAPADIRQDGGMKQVLDAGYRKTLGTMRNLVSTTANTTQTAFLQACDRAYMQLSSGAFSYQDAIRMAVRNLADGGAYVTYPTGHRDRIDVAVRRCVLTGVGQTAAAVAKKRAEDSGCKYMELTAHGGARPEHARWQGQLVQIQGKRTKKVIDGLKVFTLKEIGYGDGRGFKGWNCRHNWHPYYPGLSTPNYTPEQIAKLDEKSISYNGEKYTAYEISQMQRKGERKVRTLKRRAAALEEAAKNTDDPALKQGLNDDFSAVSVRLKDAEKTLKDFCRQTGQRRDPFREQVNGFGRSTAQRAVQAAKRQQAASQTAGNVPSGHAVEVAPPEPKDNGGTGKTYSPEKIKHLKGNYSVTFDKVSGTKEITPQLAKEFSDEYDRFGQKFGETPSVRSVLIRPYKNDGYWGTYNDNDGIISIFGAGGKEGKNTISKVAAEMKKTGKWSSSSPYHAFRHELGHALQKHLKDTVPDYEERLKKVRDIRDAFFESLTGLDEDAIMKLKKEALSIYGLIDDESLDEFISECVAEYCSKKPRKMSRDVVAALLHKGGNENAD